MKRVFNTTKDMFAIAKLLWRIRKNDQAKKAKAQHLITVDYDPKDNHTAHRVETVKAESAGTIPLKQR